MLIKCCDTSLFDMEHVYITCVSENNDPGGPWWELRCITKDRRHLVIKKGFSGLRGAVVLDCGCKSGRLIGGIKFFLGEGMNQITFECEFLKSMEWRRTRSPSVCMCPVTRDFLFLAPCNTMGWKKVRKLIHKLSTNNIHTCVFK